MQKKMQKALNKQINEELYSAYSYLAMAAEADRMKLPGFVNWFKMQYQEELAHADRFFNFILERDGEVELDAIAKPELSNETPLSLFEKALVHEQHITQCIFKLKDLARAESDYATDVFLEWFVNFWHMTPVRKIAVLRIRVPRRHPLVIDHFNQHVRPANDLFVVS